MVVHLHAGYEYDELPSPEQVAAVERLTRSPLVDLVLGEHAHTVQPITKVNGKWVVYGMGNLVGQQEVTRPETYRGILVRFTFVEQAGRRRSRSAARRTSRSAGTRRRPATRSGCAAWTSPVTGPPGPPSWPPSTAWAGRRACSRDSP